VEVWHEYHDDGPFNFICQLFLKCSRHTLADCHLYGHVHHLWTFALTLSSEKSMLNTKSGNGRTLYDGYVSTPEHAFTTLWIFCGCAAKQLA
jgi:hypothetical protein